MEPTRDDAPIVVLESFGPPHERTNPYLVQLFRSFPPNVTALYFSWRIALRGHYDAFHLHWPENMVRGSTPLRTAARCVAFLLVLVRLRITRRALVRTLHNLQPHEPLGRVQAMLIRLCDRWTTLWITLNDLTPPPTSAPRVAAPIGHYRDWFDRSAVATPVPGRLVHFGLVRKYKGIDALLSAFSDLDDSSASLHVVGSTQDPLLRSQLSGAQRLDPRVTWIDDYVPDPELQAEVCAAELIVLPFSDITNSSSLVLALSLDRPVLVPRSPATSEISQEVGPAWVMLYDGELGAETIASALASTRDRATRPDGAFGAVPDLHHRDWSTVGELHAEAFLRAVDIAEHR